MKKSYAIILLSCALALSAEAQFCTPTFASGCSLWTTQSVTIGMIDWTIGSTSCTISDYTALSTTVNAGDVVPMTVVCGNWTGCAVWVDLNEDQIFQDSENLHYAYVGGDPSYTYTFTITIPPGTPTGSYRMRVISPWGSDGFLSSNTNGYGPCGSFQYGNFDDFTLNVSGSTAVAEQHIAAPSPISASPNPTTGPLTLTSGAAAPVERIIVWSMDGRMVQDRSFSSGNAQVHLDLTALPDGAYTLQCISNASSRVVRVMKK